MLFHEKTRQCTSPILFIFLLLIFLLINFGFYIKEAVNGGTFVAALVWT
jgi:hypothetical protein